MKRLVLVLLVGLLGIGAGGGKRLAAGWNAYSRSGRTVALTTGTGDVAAVAIPQVNYGAGALSFLVRLAPVNLTGRTITTEVSLTRTGNPVFTYWGEGQGSINPCGRRANVRLYFTTSTRPYSSSVADDQPNEYWWSNPVSVDLADLTSGTFTVPVVWTAWSNAAGQQNEQGFNSAAARAQQVGFAFGGGCFFDVGVGVVSGTGTATFRVVSFGE